ncbi:MAG: amino acid--tRNA ligase-related protein [Pseudomonadota bacterium]
MQQDNEKINRLLKLRSRIISAIREFFDSADYVEVDTPSLVYNPPVDAYIDLIEAAGHRYLVPSPEIQMKTLLSRGLERIYQIGHAFRDGEAGPWHNPEFTMLEWYRVGADYRDIMDETQELAARVASLTDTPVSVPFRRESITSVFTRAAGWDPCSCWNEDRFFSDLVGRIEPAIKSEEAVFLYDYPTPVAAMAEVKTGNGTICERFELYLGGIEIANGYTELKDPAEQKMRFFTENERRVGMGKPAYPADESYISTLQGGLPPCAGAALGIDRIAAFFLQTDGIRDVMTFPDSSLR